MVFSSWPLAFCLRRYPASDTEHHVLVLQGPGVQTEISVDDQLLTNEIAEAPLHWRHEPGTGPVKCGVKWRLLFTSPKASAYACYVHLSQYCDVITVFSSMSDSAVNNDRKPILWEGA